MSQKGLVVPFRLERNKLGAAKAFRHDGVPVNDEQRAFAKKRETYMVAVETGVAKNLKNAFYSEELEELLARQTESGGPMIIPVKVEEPAVFAPMEPIRYTEKLAVFIHEDPAQGGLFAEIRIVKEPPVAD